MPRESHEFDPRAPVQFRPGYPLQAWLWEFAIHNGISVNETARRLVVLALCRLGVESYLHLARLAETLPDSYGRTDFVLACDRVRTAVDSANRVRRDLKKPTMSTEEVEQFIKETVDEILKGRSAPGAKASPKRKRGS